LLLKGNLAFLAELQAELLVGRIGLGRQVGGLEQFELFEGLDLLEQVLLAEELVVLVLEECGLEVGQLLLGEHTEVAADILASEVPTVLLLPEAVFDVVLVEIGDHVLGVVG